MVYSIILRRADRMCLVCLSYKGILKKMWTKVIVICIPKSGRCEHTKVKDYRPKSLTSFILKTLENLVDMKLS